MRQHGTCTIRSSTVWHGMACMASWNGVICSTVTVVQYPVQYSVVHLMVTTLVTAIGGNTNRQCNDKRTSNRRDNATRDTNKPRHRHSDSMIYNLQHRI